MSEQEKCGKVINSLEETREFIAQTKNMFKIGFPDIVSDVFDNTLCAISDAIILLKAQEPKIISLRDVVCADVGNVVWLETYYDGATGIEPFLVCIDFTQKPVIINGWDSFYNISEQELNDDIVNSFNDKITVRKFRFWSSKPTDEQRKAVKWDD